MLILSSQGDSPTLKNIDFASAGVRFPKNQDLGIKGAIESVLGVSWAHLGSLLRRFGGVLVASWWPTWIQVGLENGTKIDE